MDRYNKENTRGITIEMDIMPASSLEEKLPAAIASKTAPALIIRGNFDTATYTDNGILTPLDDFFEQTGADASNFSDASLQALQYQKVQMMIPMQVHSTFLYWNKDLFEAAGLDPETPPATWEEAAEYALKISDPSRKLYGSVSRSAAHPAILMQCSSPTEVTSSLQTVRVLFWTALRT